MSTRRGYRKGEWLVVDDESGLTKYASQTTQDYWGRRIDKRYADGPHPQDFIRPLNDPKSLPFLRRPDSTSAACVSYPVFVGNSGVRVGNPTSPAYHLYRFGIGEMKIGCTFIVR